jgi:hypothetical protein
LPGGSPLPQYGEEGLSIGDDHEEGPHMKHAFRKRAVVAATVFAAALGFSSSAHAGYAIVPADGAQTGPTPSFLVYRDPTETLPLVYVATSPAMSASGLPVSEVGSCSPSTPYTDPNKYSCAPAFYSSTSTGSLAPGSYYWWFTFYRTDPGNSFATLHISGPFNFTVVAPTAPASARLVSPADGQTVSENPVVTVHAPANSTLDIYLSDSSDQSADGSPLGVTEGQCSTSVSTEGDYTCEPDIALDAGATYYWWAVITVDGSAWTYGPQTFFVATAPPSSGGGGAGGGGGGGGGAGGGGGGHPPHGVSYAPLLSSSAHYKGTSVKQTRLSKAAYSLSKVLGVPKTIAVACWGQKDWTAISGDNPESYYSVLGFFLPSMPHWVNLSPGICHTMETLIYHRPHYANIYTANAVDTLTHEMIHALGLRSEAKTECLAMQLSFITAIGLGVPENYAYNLDRLSLDNYGGHPAAYINRANCRENGAWDIWPGRNSLPWHLPAV